MNQANETHQQHEYQRSLQRSFEPVCIAPFSVARVGGIVPRHLDALVLEKTAIALAEVFEIERGLQQLVLPIEEALYRLVPLVGEQKELRRRILAVKRNVHNLRLWAEAWHDVELVAPVMGEDGSLLRKWYHLAVHHETIAQRAYQTYQEELLAANATIAHGMNDQHLQQGLALASPELLKEITKPSIPDEWCPTSKMARSGLSYLTRAAFKTSPLSTFTQMALADFALSAPEEKTALEPPVQPTLMEQTSAHLHRTVRLLRALPASLLMLIAYHKDLAPALCFEPNQGLDFSHADADILGVFSTQYYATGDFTWKSELLCDQRLRLQSVPAFAAFLKSGRRVTYQELLALLPRTSKGQDAHLNLTQLLTRQIIRPVAPYSRRDEQPLYALTHVLATLEHPLAKMVVEHIHALLTFAEQSKEAPGSERLLCLTRVRQEASTIFIKLGTEPPAWLQNNLLYEDVHYEHQGEQHLSLHTQIQDDLASIAERMRPHIQRTKLYDYLYQDFVERFGPNGETDDILGFFTSFLKREDAAELIGRTIADDRIALQETARPKSLFSAGASAVPPAATLLYQLVSASSEAVSRGEYLLIVNQVMAGEGGLLGRFQSILGSEQGNLPEKLRHWIHNSLYKDRKVVEVPLVGDWHNLQGEVGLTEQVLQWPTELSTTGDEERTLQLRDIRLRANASDETLSFVDARGQIIALTYQGVVPQHLFSQQVRLLITLMNPWISNYPIGWQGSSLNLNNKTPEQVEFYPRQQDGRVVFRRARWRFPAAQIPVHQKGESDFDFFVRVERWRIQHQLPEEVFVSTDRPQIAMEAKARKPIWLHFHSPHALELLRQCLDKEVIAVCFTEALPTRNDHWLGANMAHGAPGRASEFMTLLHWPLHLPAASLPKNTTYPFVHTPEHYSNPWLYFKIYPSRSDQLDEVIRFIVTPSVSLARAKTELERWFFIRYMDQRGWHIRLRMQGPSRLHHEVYREISDLIESVLPDLPHQKQRRLLPAHMSPPLMLAKPGFALAQYKPEYEKYGGKIGVLIAEKLFEASSEIALRAVEREPRMDMKRVLLSLHLMQLVTNIILEQPGERTHFLEHYHWYWGGQEKKEGELVRKIFQQSAKARQPFLMKQMTEDLQDPVVQHFIEQYRRITVSVMQDLMVARHELSEAIIHMCFDYVHMNNNRLGVIPFEESYLAALLLEIDRAAGLHSVASLPMS